MEFEKIHNKGQAQLFRNPYLEMLTKTHPLVIWGMYTPVMIYMLYYSGNSLGFTTGRIILTFFGGMFFWTFFEYLAHRFLFHMIANSGRAIITQGISSGCLCHLFPASSLHQPFLV
jgi:hypothetical protein